MRARHRGSTSKRTCGGFTLVEALLSIVILGLMAASISGVYRSSLQSLEVEPEHLLLDSQLRSCMEMLVGMPFDKLVDASSEIAVNGQDHTVTWSVELIDLDGDSIPEPNAKQVTVSSAGRSLTTILVDHENRVRKIL